MRHVLHFLRQEGGRLIAEHMMEDVMTPSPSPKNKGSLSVFRGLLVSSLFLLALATPARADVTYIYVGKPFDFFSGSYACPPVCSIMGSFTLSQPLAANLNFSFITPSSFMFTDRVNIFNNSNSSFPAFGFQVATDSGGNITDWNIFLELNGTTLKLTTNGRVFATDRTEVDSVALSVALNRDQPGSWSTAPPVPEPGSLLLVGTGLLGIVGAVRRKWLG